MQSMSEMNNSSYDSVATAATAAIFSFGLGIAGLAVPLLAIYSGYSAAQVGILIAVSAGFQMLARLRLAALMRRVPDKTLVVSASLCLTGACLLLVLSTSWQVFAASQVLQGGARALFWTGIQTHAVRLSHSAVRGLAGVNVASGVGQLAGPLVAGVLSESSVRLALLVGSVVCALSLVPAQLLIRLPPFVPMAEQRVPGRIWRRPGVTAGCGSAATAGAWRGLLGSYVPVLLEQARQTPTVIGALVSTADAASVAGGAIAAGVSTPLLRRTLVGGVLVTGGGLAALAPLADSVPLAAAALAASGIGAGVLQTLGPAVAAKAVHAQEQGDVIASTGTFRAAALFVTPLTMAALVIHLPLTAAMCAAGLLTTLPALMMRQRARWTRGRRG
jgi:hypothetical protein